MKPISALFFEVISKVAGDEHYIISPGDGNRALLIEVVVK